MKILVTGSSGTIGTRLCEKLLEQGHEVIGADWEPCKWKQEVDDLRIDIDLRDEKEFLKLPTDVEMIIHLAANARVYDLVVDPSRARDNFDSTFNVLEFARVNGIKKFMFASSRETYGNIDAELYSEDMARIENCESAYTASKVGGEALVHSYRECYGIDSIIFRFSNVYGMYDDSNRFVPLFIRLAKNNKPMTVFGESKTLDFTYIDDTVDGIVLGIEKFDAAKGETINLGNQDGTNLVEAANAIKDLIGSSSEISVTESRIGEVTKYIADISKAKNMLGYSPKTPFSEGIKKSVEWYESNSLALSEI